MKPNIRIAPGQLATVDIHVIHLPRGVKTPLSKKPQLTDAKGKALKAGTIIRGGSLIRIAGVIAAWEKGAKRGVSLWPDAVRVIKLSEGFDANAAFGAAEDGFDADEYEPNTSFGDGEDSDTPADDADTHDGDDAFTL